MLTSKKTLGIKPNLKKERRINKQRKITIMTIMISKKTLGLRANLIKERRINKQRKIAKRRNK